MFYSKELDSYPVTFLFFPPKLAYSVECKWILHAVTWRVLKEMDWYKIIISYNAQQSFVTWPETLA